METIESDDELLSYTLMARRGDLLPNEKRELREILGEYFRMQMHFRGFDFTAQQRPSENSKEIAMALREESEHFLSSNVNKIQTLLDQFCPDNEEASLKRLEEAFTVGVRETFGEIGMGWDSIFAVLALATQTAVRAQIRLGAKSMRKVYLYTVRFFAVVFLPWLAVNEGWSALIDEFQPFRTTVRYVPKLEGGIWHDHRDTFRTAGIALGALVLGVIIGKTY